MPAPANVEPIKVVPTKEKGNEEVEMKKAIESAEKMQAILDSTKSRGYHAYVQINIRGEAKDHIIEILDIIDAFEKKYHVIAHTWKLQTSKDMFNDNNIIDGIWIDTDSNANF